MSALRYCGELRIRVTLVWTANQDQYRCYIKPTNGDHASATIFVGPPAVSDLAIDSPEAIDAAAHAALSFAADEGWPVESYALSDADCAGWHITRKPQDLVRMCQDDLIAGAYKALSK